MAQSLGLTLIVTAAFVESGFEQGVEHISDERYAITMTRRLSHCTHPRARLQTAGRSECFAEHAEPLRRMGHVREAERCVQLALRNRAQY